MALGSKSLSFCLGDEQFILSLGVMNTKLGEGNETSFIVVIPNGAPALDLLILIDNEDVGYRIHDNVGHTFSSVIYICNHCEGDNNPSVLCVNTYERLGMGSIGAYHNSTILEEIYQCIRAALALRAVRLREDIKIIDMNGKDIVVIRTNADLTDFHSTVRRIGDS